MTFEHKQTVCPQPAQLKSPFFSFCKYIANNRHLLFSDEKYFLIEEG